MNVVDFLLPDERAAVVHLSDRIALAVGPRQWGTFDVLCRLSRVGLASQCGRLFHATGRTDSAAVAVIASGVLQGDLIG